ncbi:hypothetical protein OAR00_00285 [Alphaproteobacteria bacterium]|nr:hypothetical protein [Alphaproteobacteria bacterium]MDC1022971.1 hypothetical protein [Alphaproteobacteria bacterium]
MNIVNLLFSILLSFFLLSNISYASEKTKWFAKDCYKQTSMIIEAIGKKVTLGYKYSYYPLTREPKYNYYQIKINVDYILPWGEKKKKLITCQYDDEGNVMSTAGID